MNRVLSIFTLLVAFSFSPAALAAPEEAKVAEATEAVAAEETKATEAVAEETEDAKELAVVADPKAYDDADTDTDTSSSADTDGEETDLVSTGEDAVKAFQGGEYTLGVSAILMLLIGGARRFKLLSKLPSNVVPWVSAGLGVATVLAVDLATGGALSLERVLAGLTAGLAASGMWSLIGKHVPWLGDVD